MQALPPSSPEGASPPHPHPPPIHLLENRPMSGAFTVEASLLLPGEDVPDDDGLRVILCVHQGAEGHQVSEQGDTFYLLKVSCFFFI